MLSHGLSIMSNLYAYVYIAYPQSELYTFKAINLDMQIRPVFADLVTYILTILYSSLLHMHVMNVLVGTHVLMQLKAGFVSFMRI